MQSSQKASSKLLNVIKQDVVDLCPAIGLTTKATPNINDPKYTHTPISLFPTPFPLELYKESIALQPALGQVIAGIVRDPDNNIYEVLKDMQKLDEFMNKLLEVSHAFKQ
jgi:hypothetical protein